MPCYAERFKPVFRTAADTLRHVLQLGELLAAKGWNYGFLIKPPALHFCFTLQHTNGVDAMCHDLKACCAELRAQSKNGKAGKGQALGDKAKIYGMAGVSANADSVADVLLQYQDLLLAP